MIALKKKKINYFIYWLNNTKINYINQKTKTKSASEAFNL
jgi:hypothetical protein